MATEAELIRQAQSFVRKGGTIGVVMPSGQSTDTLPVAIMSLTPRQIWFLWANDDHPHGDEIREILEGDDDAVLIRSRNGSTFTIWGTWTPEQDQALRHWKVGADNRTGPYLIGVSPDPPDQVRFEG